MRQVVADEGLNEVIAVVVTILHAQLQRLSDALARLLKQFRPKLLGEKLILATLVNKNAFGKRPATHQLTGIVDRPRALVVA